MKRSMIQIDQTSFSVLNENKKAIAKIAIREDGKWQITEGQFKLPGVYETADAAFIAYKLNF